MITMKTNEDTMGNEKVSDTGEQERDAGANSLTRMLSILDLFTEDNPLWATNEILAALEVSRSTGYRYIRSMASAGLISAVGNGYYILGPRIIELDLQIRNTDPLLQASEGVLEELCDTTGHSALLCTLFQNSVLCVRESLAPFSPADLMGRGQRRPLLRGAMSKVILAHLSAHRLRSIYNRRQDEILEARLGGSWDEFRTNMAAIRNDGYASSSGEFTQTMIGASAPVFNAGDEVIGSVGVAWEKSEMAQVDIARIALSVKRAGREISSRMRDRSMGKVLRPRAVG